MNQNRAPRIEQMYWFHYPDRDKYEAVDKQTAYNMMRASQRRNGWRYQGMKYIGISSGEFLRDVRKNHTQERYRVHEIADGMPDQNQTYKEAWAEAWQKEIDQAKENRKAIPQANVVIGGGALPNGMSIGRPDPIRYD